MDLGDLLGDVLAPIATTPEGAVAVARLKLAIADVVKAADGAQVDWSAQLASVLPKLVKAVMRIRA